MYYIKFIIYVIKLQEYKNDCLLLNWPREQTGGSTGNWIIRCNSFACLMIRTLCIYRFTERFSTFQFWFQLIWLSCLVLHLVITRPTEKTQFRKSHYTKPKRKTHQCKILFLCWICCDKSFIDLEGTGIKHLRNWWENWGKDRR